MMNGHDPLGNSGGYDKAKAFLESTKLTQPTPPPPPPQTPSIEKPPIIPEPIPIEPSPNQTPLPPIPPNIKEPPWDSGNGLLVWLTTVESEMPTPPPTIVEVALDKTKTLLNGLQIYFSDYDSYKLAFRFAFAHYIASSRIWKPNPYFAKYNVPSINAQIVQSSTDGSSSASAFMFKSIQVGDFVMSDLMQTPYGMYVYEILEQMRTLVVTI